VTRKRRLTCAALLTASLAALVVQAVRRPSPEATSHGVERETEAVHATVVPSQSWGSGHVVLEWPQVTAASAYTIYRSRYPIYDRRNAESSETTFDPIETVRPGRHDSPTKALL